MEFFIEFFGINFLQAQLPRFWNGFQLTIAIAATSMIGALIWALMLVAPRMSSVKAIVWPLMVYVEFVRNTPLLLQIYLSYFGLPLLGLPLSAFLCGVIAIASQHGAFLCEIFRAGIEAVSKQQWEGALALGMTKKKAKYNVILPQAF